jgi:hypothetical protein
MWLHTKQVFCSVPGVDKGFEHNEMEDCSASARKEYPDMTQNMEGSDNKFCIDSHIQEVVVQPTVTSHTKCIAAYFVDFANKIA